MTLVELLVVFSIIGVLVALLLPAVQAARETARSVECQNHLRQFGLAVANHHDVHRQFPSGGWGYRWVGDPDRGFDRAQPGGWVYNVLPFVEQQSVREIGQGAALPQKSADLQRVLRTPLGVFQCPTRRATALYPYLGRFPLYNTPAPADAAKSDYAGNGGDVTQANTPGPPGMTSANLRNYPWPVTTNLTGLFFVGSRIRLAEVTDGTSNTYLIGEKSVRRDAPTTSVGRDIGDDQTMYVGDDTDIRRWTNRVPVRDMRGTGASDGFGSAHPGGCHFVFCDGSVHRVAYTIDLAVHRRLGNRHDGQPVGEF